MTTEAQAPADIAAQMKVSMQQAAPASLNYSPALFPTVLIPSLSPIPMPAKPKGEVAAAGRGPAERDELLEYGAIFALMKLFYS